MKHDSSQLKKHISSSPKLVALKERRKKARKRFTIILMMFFLVLLMGIIYFLRYPTFQLTSITVSGNQVTDSKDITEHIHRFLEGNYAYIIPHRNALLYPKKNIIADLGYSFPRLRGIHVYRTSFSSLAVSVSEARGKALWCGLAPSSSPETEQCYFTDPSGVLIAEAPYFSGSVYTRFYGSPLFTDGNIALGHAFVPESVFKDDLLFADQVTDLGFPVRSVVLKGDENDFILDLGSEKTALMRYNADQSPTILIANLKLALGQADLKKAVATDKNNLEYFDLRFTNKVYYKFSDDTAATQ